MKNNLKISREILEAVRPQGTLYRLASLTAFYFKGGHDDKR